MRKLFGLLLLAGFLAAESAQAQQVLYKAFENNTEGVTDWINEDCGPSDAAAIRGYVDHAMIRRGSRLLPNPRSYTVHVWCRADHSPQVWQRVGAVRSKTGALPMTGLIRSGRLAVISSRTADSRLAEVILFRR